ncbi:MAG: hypothetical protein ACK5L5_12335 [Bacteroidales bacterium]
MKSGEITHEKFFRFMKKLGVKNHRSFIWDYTDGMTGSLRDLIETDEQMYDDMIVVLEALVKEADASADRWRKRLMAAIGNWLKLMNRESNAKLIKAIACRASGCKNFNAIPEHKLASLYNAFRHKSADLQMVMNMTDEELLRQSIMN